MFLGGKEQKRNPKLESVQKTAHSLQEKKKPLSRIDK